MGPVEIQNSHSWSEQIELGMNSGQELRVWQVQQVFWCSVIIIYSSDQRNTQQTIPAAVDSKVNITYPVERAMLGSRSCRPMYRHDIRYSTLHMSPNSSERNLQLTKTAADMLKTLAKTPACQANSPCSINLLMFRFLSLRASCWNDAGIRMR